MSGLHKGHRDRGAAAVEMALVLPILLILVFGMIDFGRMLNDQIRVTNAARDGVRMAAMGLPDDISARVGATKMDPPLSASPPTPPCPASPGPDTETSVTVTYQFTFITPLGPLVKMFAGSNSLDGDVALSSKATMRCGG